MRMNTILRQSEGITSSATFGHQHVDLNGLSSSGQIVFPIMRQAIYRYRAALP
jgi:hypothetical protein